MDEMRCPPAAAHDVRVRASSRRPGVSTDRRTEGRQLGASQPQLRMQAAVRSRGTRPVLDSESEPFLEPRIPLASLGSGASAGRARSLAGRIAAGSQSPVGEDQDVFRLPKRRGSWVVGRGLWVVSCDLRQCQCTHGPSAAAELLQMQMRIMPRALMDPLNTGTRQRAGLLLIVPEFGSHPLPSVARGVSVLDKSPTKAILHSRRPGGSRRIPTHSKDGWPSTSRGVPPALPQKDSDPLRIYRR
ncbi:hypothetical protein C2E23DRAFT_491524 [Lenzites betulinus]|nr:hypothetical protein C2E23DRAFT_491524 [Lenzites betulinus]